MSQIKDASINYSATNVTVTTTTETVVATATAVKFLREVAQVFVMAFVQFTSGTGATGYTLRVRRGTTAAGALLGEGTSEVIRGAAGAAESGMVMAAETITGMDQAQYVLTIEQAGATGDATITAAGILVISA